MTLTIYGDFNCPFSALASVRADVLIARGSYKVEWRAIQHDAAIRPGGEPIDGDAAVALATEIASILELSGSDLHLHLVVPPIRSNTALASAASAAATNDAGELRGRLFTAVWAEGRNLGDPAELRRLGAEPSDVAHARVWQKEFEALPRPITPTVVLPDGYISRGLGALSRLAEFADADQRHLEDPP